MGLGAVIGNFFKGLFSKIKKLFDISKPFANKILGDTAQLLWTTSQDLLMEAVGYVATKGFPTEEESKKAFKDFMQEKSTIALDDIKTRELNWIRESALGIWEKSKE